MEFLKVLPGNVVLANDRELHVFFNVWVDGIVRFGNIPRVNGISGFEHSELEGLLLWVILILVLVEEEDLSRLGLEEELAKNRTSLVLLDLSGDWVLHDKEVEAFEHLGVWVHSPRLNGGNLTTLVLLFEFLVWTNFAIVLKGATYC